MGARRAARGAALAFALTLAVLACGSPRAAAPAPLREAVVTFRFEAGRDAVEDSILVLVRDSATVADARRTLSTGEGPKIPIGPIVRGSGVDPRFPWHFVPERVRLTSQAMELCDGAPMRTPEEVDEFFRLANARDTATYCPWSARPVAVSAP